MIIMMIETLKVEGIPEALKAMRNPMNSWRLSDSEYDEVGPKDKDLSLRLQKAGPEHCKHLRMIMIWCEISFPRYWWTEFDTYRNGVEKISCSTMHKLTAKPFEESDFEIDSDEWRHDITEYMNKRYKDWQEAADEDEKKMRWRDMIQCLPQSYIQKRTVMMSYAALRNIVRQRKGHKLVEWAEFIEWARTLPESWMIFDDL